MIHGLERILTSILFPASELALVLFRRSRGLGGRSEDQGTVSMLWVVIGAAIGAAALLIPFRVAPLPLGDAAREGLVVAFVAAGMLLRWTAILTLGKFFTVDVAIHPDQTVVRKGPYAWVRHPSYSGLLLIFLGMALLFRSWLCLGVMMVPIFLALWRRIGTEEKALRQGLGAPYEDYCRITKRLVPGLF